MSIWPPCDLIYEVGLNWILFIGITSIYLNITGRNSDWDKLIPILKRKGTYSVGACLRKLWSCSNAAPVMMLPKKTLTSRNKWYFAADLLSKDERDVKPSIFDMVTRIVGRRIRNIFRAIPGRKPWMTDLTVLLWQKFLTFDEYKYGPIPKKESL